METRTEKWIYSLIFGSLGVYALGLLTSISVLALAHIFIIIPILYFLPKTQYSKWSKSTWAFVFLTLSLIVSVLVNQDIMVKGYQPLSKIKYFVIGFLSIAPFAYFFLKKGSSKNVAILIYLFLLSTSVSTSYGIFSHFITNPGNAKWRNSGLYGMVMNYAHNLSYFEIILFGMILYKDEMKKVINVNYLYLAFIINTLGFFFSFTRGAWIGLFAGIPLYFFKKNRKLFLSSLGIVFLAGVIFYFAAGSSMYRQDNDVSRLGQWQTALKAFEERPFFGVGFLNFEQVCFGIKKKYSLLAPDFCGHAHNIFLEILSNAGIVGFTFFMLWLFFWAKEMYRRDDLIAKITFAFIFVFMAGGLTQSTITLGINLFFIMIVYSISQMNLEILKD